MRVVMTLAVPRYAPLAPGGTRSQLRPFSLKTHMQSCAQITAEIQANNIKVQELADEQGLKVGQNVAAGVAGIIVWPLLFAMDFKGAASKEVAALQARQQYLTTLAAERCAQTPPLRRVQSRN